MGIFQMGRRARIVCIVACLRFVATAQTNLLSNPGFETTTSGSPASWNVTDLSNEGSAAVSTYGRRSGNYSLALNWATGLGTTSNPSLLGAGQSIGGTALLGKTVYVSGWLSASTDATALVTVLAYRSDGRAYFMQLRQGASTTPVQVRDVLAIPNDPMVMFTVVLCQMEGTGSAYFDDLSATLVQPADWPSQSATTTTSSRSFSAQVTVDARSVIRTVPSTLFGQNLEWVWSGNGTWDPAQNRANPVVNQLTADLKVSLLRFPGGIMADYYDWRNAVGPVAQRPYIQAMPGGAIDKPYFGTDEAIQFASGVGAELLITVNVGTGTAQMAADWVQYANRNGLKVRYWEIGNEVYVRNGVMFAPVTMTPQTYAQKVVEFARAMRRVDSRIKIGAIACESMQTMDCPTYPGWTATVLQNAANDIDFLAVHNSYAPGVDTDLGWSTSATYMAMLAAPQHIRRSLDALARKVTVYAPQRADAIKIAVTEWGPYFAHTTDNRFSEHTKTMASAVYVASAAKVFLESKSIEITNAFQLLDGLFSGWIGFRDGQRTPKPSYYALQLFTRNLGQSVVSTNTTSPTFDTLSLGAVPAASAVPYVESVATKSADGRTLYVAVWNKHSTSTANVDCSVQNFTVLGAVEMRSLVGTAADSNTGTQPLTSVVSQAVMEQNSSYYAGSSVSMPVASVTPQAGRLSIAIPPMSLVMLKMAGQ